MKKIGRPPLPPEQRRDRRFSLDLTAEELRRLDDAVRERRFSGRCALLREALFQYLGQQ